MHSAARVQPWLAALRIVTGGVFVYMGIGHALAGWATADGFERAISGIARSDPLGWYTSFMLPIVLGAPSIFGPLFVFGMITTGLGLILGALTLPALLAAVWLSANSLLMGFGAGSIHHSINVLMLTIELGFLWTGAWRRTASTVCSLVSASHIERGPHHWPRVGDIQRLGFAPWEAHRKCLHECARR